MRGIEYFELTVAEIMPEMFRDFKRRQVVTYRMSKSDPARGIELARGEGWTEIEDNFIQDWNDARLEKLCVELRDTLSRGGAVICAYVSENESDEYGDGGADDDMAVVEDEEETEEYDWYTEDEPPCRAVIGFCSVEPELFGSEKQYIELSCLQVTEQYRGNGIGKGLFRRAVKAARTLGGRKLYISGHPAVESQAFYKAMGCVEAAEYNEARYAEDPCDCQLECELFPRSADGRLTIEEYETMAGEIVDAMPDEFFYKLNGGVIVRPEHKLHEQSRQGAPMYIMGEYTRSAMMGRMILLYYGSFMRTYGNHPRQLQREELRKIIAHEFRHHVEWLSGECGLEVEDRLKLASYLGRFT